VLRAGLQGPTGGDQLKWRSERQVANAKARRKEDSRVNVTIGVRWQRARSPASREDHQSV